jgi:hypothetical protein
MSADTAPERNALAATAAAAGPARAGVDALLLLQKSDLAHLAATPALLEGQRLLFVDPGLLDEAAVRGFQRCEFRRLPVDADFQARAATEAMTLATLVDVQLAHERQGLLRPFGAAGVLPQLHGWDVGLFFLALQRAVVARQLGALIEATFPERRIGVLRPSAAQQMYFDSFVATDLVAADPARFAVLDSYDEARWQRADAYADVFDTEALRAVMAGGRIGAVTHVPTCFYDRNWLAAEVSRAFEFTLDLASPFWDVPVHRGRSWLVDRTAVPADAAALAYRERAAGVLERVLGHLLPHAGARRQQIAAWADRCHWQAQNFLALMRSMAGLSGTARPHFLLADQDTGLNGPLFSVADALGSPITVVPHSGHPSMLLPHARRVTAVERAGYGAQPRSLLGQVVAVRPVNLGSKLPRQPHGRLKTLCLLLNSMQTEGLSFVDAHALAAFYKPLLALCEAAGIELILRPKPGAPALSVLAGALGVPPATLVQHTTQPLDQLAARCELCIAYGEPTTGVAPFLDGGSLVLQVGEQRWPTDYTVCLPLIRDGVVPLLDHRAALKLVQQLIADPVAFTAYRSAQNGAFEARCEGAHDHLFPFESHTA